MEASRGTRTLDLLGAMMGHASLATTQIYMHYAPAHGGPDAIEAAFAVHSRSTTCSTNSRVSSAT